MSSNALASVLKEVRACTLCAPQLSHGPRPVVRIGARASLLIIGQAPGLKVHQTGIPWNDASGDRLRDWLQLDRSVFYDEQRIAIMPMGFCYPGRGASGDLPPRPECAPLWHPRLLPLMPRVQLTLLIGAYAHARMLGEANGPTLTETVRKFRTHLPRFFALPHPSPRNTLWLKKNPWFERRVVPALRVAVRAALELPPTTRRKVR